jgi:hypothetical protein
MQKGENVANTFLATETVTDAQTARAAKLRRLEGRVFGIRTVSCTVLAEDSVYVPFRLIRFRFSIDRPALPALPGLAKADCKAVRKGEVAVVYDCNEAHAFECDLTEMGGLPLCRMQSVPQGWSLLKAGCGAVESETHAEAAAEAGANAGTEAATEAEATARTFVQNKVMRRLYATEASLETIENTAFFRPAIMLRIRYSRSEAVNERFAYLDAYGVENEHILGLKMRVGGG